MRIVIPVLLAGLSLLLHVPAASSQQATPADSLSRDAATDATEGTPGREFSGGSPVSFAVRGVEYNRVEGLRVRLGPVLETDGERRLRARAQLTWRTEGRAPLAADRMGYRVMAEKSLGDGRPLRVGGGVHSAIDPIEDRGLSGKENSWSTLALTSDHRDHFENRGWSVFFRATSEGSPLAAAGDFRSERHRSVGAADPWSLFRSGRGWRAQPRVAEGTVRSAALELTADTRDDGDDPGAGWFARGGWRQGLGGSLTLPGPTSGEPGRQDPAEASTAVDAHFSTARLDLRRYLPVGSSGTLAFRASVEGSVDGAPLPPQHQRALGGPGSLPGHGVFAGDCGARTGQVTWVREDDEATLFSSYGCDRVALLQAEYRGPLSLDLGFGSAEKPEGRSRVGTNWAVFLNAGRGWAAGEASDPGRVNSPTLYDAGLGLLTRTGGIYWAIPLNEGVSGSTLTVRLERRF